MHFEFWDNQFYGILYLHLFCWSKYCTECHNRITEEAGTTKYLVLQIDYNLIWEMTLNMLTLN